MFGYLESLVPESLKGNSNWDGVPCLVSLKDRTAKVRKVTSKEEYDRLWNGLHQGSSLSSANIHRPLAKAFGKGKTYKYWISKRQYLRDILKGCSVKCRGQIEDGIDCTLRLLGFQLLAHKQTDKQIEREVEKLQDVKTLKYIHVKLRSRDGTGYGPNFALVPEVAYVAAITEPKNKAVCSMGSDMDVAWLSEGLKTLANSPQQLGKQFTVATAVDGQQVIVVHC